MFTTRQDVLEHIAQIIEANGLDVARRDEFDLNQIADATFEFSGELQKFVSIADEAEFWAAVQDAAL